MSPRSGLLRGAWLVAAGGVRAVEPGGTVFSAPPSSTVMAAASAVAPAPSATTTALAAPLPGSSTLAQAPAVSSTAAAPAPAPASLPARVPVSSTPIAPRAVAASATAHELAVAFEELHKRASIVMLPSAFAAHVKAPTGENVEIFFSWYIGSFYSQSVQRDGKIISGPDIRAIFSMFIGADAKWAFLGERRIRPASAFGYYGGLLLPFAGGPVRASEIAKKEAQKKQAAGTKAGKAEEELLSQVFVNNLYLALSKNFGPVAVTAGGMYGLKKSMPLFFPALRSPFTSAVRNPPSPTPWLAFGGLDFTWRGQHLKVEVATLPEPLEKLEIASRPWLVQTHIDGFLGFDVAFVKDPIGYEIIGYYLLPFVRWPDKKRLEKETERLRARRTGAVTAP